MNSICSQCSSRTTNSAKPGSVSTEQLKKLGAPSSSSSSSSMISETERLGWAFLQIVSLPTLTCLVQSGKRSRNSSQQKINDASVNDAYLHFTTHSCIHNSSTSHTHTRHGAHRKKLNVIHSQGQQSSSSTCWSLSFSCRGIRCRLLFGPAAWCKAADEVEPDTPLSRSSSAPAGGSKWVPGSSFKQGETGEKVSR